MVIASRRLGLVVMKRSKLKRQAPLGRSPMKRGRKRSAAEQERIYGPRDFRDWLHQQPCVITGTRSNIEQVHVIGGGVGRKAGWRFTVPMTDELHRELHQHGVRTFERKWGVNLVCLAGMIQDRWEREQHNPEHVSSIVKRVLKDIA